MSISGEVFGFSDIFNESQDVQQIATLIQGTPNQIIVTPNPTYIKLSTPQDIGTASAVTFASSTVTSSKVTGLPTNSLVSTDNTSTLQGVTITNANGNTSNLSADGKTLNFTNQQNISTSGTPSFAGETLTGNLTMGTNAISSCGSITSSGNFTNGTNSMTTGTLSCSSANISGLPGPNILSIDAKGNVTTADVSVDNALLGGDASGNIGGVTLANTSTNGVNSTLAYNGTTRTLTLQGSLSTSARSTIQNLIIQGGGVSGSALQINCGSGSLNGIIISDPSVAATLLMSGGSGAGGYEIAMGNYNPGGAGAGFAIGSNSAGTFPQMYMFNKTTDASPALYLQDAKGNNMFTSSTSSMTIPALSSGAINCGAINAGTNTLNCGAATVGALTSAAINAGTNSITGGSATFSSETLNGNLTMGTNAISSCGAITSSGVWTNTNTTDATSTSTGSVILSGGLGSAKSLWAQLVASTNLIEGIAKTSSGTDITLTTSSATNQFITPTAAINIFLPNASSKTGLRFRISNWSETYSNSLVLNTASGSGQAIYWDGIYNSGSWQLVPQEMYDVISDGSNWMVVNTGIGYGSWTPGLSSSGSTTGIAYSTQSGNFFRNKHIVTCSFFINTSAKLTAGGNILLTGLPFSYPSTPKIVINKGTVWGSNWSAGAAVINGPFILDGIAGTTTMNVNFSSGTSAYSNLTQAAMNNSVIVAGEFSYSMI